MSPLATPALPLAASTKGLPATATTAPAPPGKVAIAQSGAPPGAPPPGPPFLSALEDLLARTATAEGPKQQSPATVHGPAGDGHEEKATVLAEAGATTVAPAIEVLPATHAPAQRTVAVPADPAPAEHTQAPALPQAAPAAAELAPAAPAPAEAEPALPAPDTPPAAAAAVAPAVAPPVAPAVAPAAPPALTPPLPSTQAPAGTAPPLPAAPKPASAPQLPAASQPTSSAQPPSAPSQPPAPPTHAPSPPAAPAPAPATAAATAPAPAPTAALATTAALTPQTGPLPSPSISTAASPPAPVLASGVNLHQAIEVVHATVELAARAGVTQARIALSPEALGEIRIHLSQSAQGLVARITAATPAAAQALAEGRAELRSSLSSLGLTALHVGGSDAAQAGLQQRSQGSPRELFTAPNGHRSAGPFEEEEQAGETESETKPSRADKGALVDVLA